jgi:hypothetical protein
MVCCRLCLGACVGRVQCVCGVDVRTCARVEACARFKAADGVTGSVGGGVTGVG